MNFFHLEIQKIYSKKRSNKNKENWVKITILIDKVNMLMKLLLLLDYMKMEKVTLKIKVDQD